MLAMTILVHFGMVYWLGHWAIYNHTEPQPAAATVLQPRASQLATQGLARYVGFMRPNIA